MLIGKNSSNKLLLALFKDFSRSNTVTSLAKTVGLSRVGVWKILKTLEENNFIKLESINGGKTSTDIVKLNWNNMLIDKALSFYLTEESSYYIRWKINFNELENLTDFLILYGSIVKNSKNANDIDLIGVTNNRRNFIKIQRFIDKVQKTQTKKIHNINFTLEEFKKELLKPNHAFIDSITTGVILLGQENFIKFIKEIKK